MRNRTRNTVCAITLAMLAMPAVAAAQAGGKNYVGGIGSLTLLSADGQSIVTPTLARDSQYKPENGPGFSFFYGRDINDWVTLQANYVWNRNDLTFVSTETATTGGSFYRETRDSTQQAFLAGAQVYFRKRASRLRPYLATSAGFVHLASSLRDVLTAAGAPTLPPAKFSSTEAALRVSVGMDVALGRGWWFRYSFAETLSHNPLSDHLSPPGSRTLKNFQNMFGFLVKF
jgi:opacity protein-like surface antigen